MQISSDLCAVVIVDRVQIKGTDDYFHHQR